MRNWHGNLSPFGRWHTSGARGADGAFTPASLFASGEEGAWYEPSPTTCFTDTAGTIAATYGDAVARINDLSGNGNHATQGTESARPILARVPEGGRRNLVGNSEDIDAEKDAIFRATLAETATDRDGNANSAWVFSDNNSGGSNTAALRFLFSGLTASSIITFSVYAKADQLSWLRIATGDGSVYYNLSTGSVGTQSSATGEIESIGGGWYRCSYTDTTPSTSEEIFVYPASADNTPNVDLDGTSSVIIGSIQLEAASSATAYQKVVDQYDITEAGVTSLEYLAFDGSDDVMVANFATTTYFNSSVLGLQVESGAGDFVIFGPEGDNTALILVGDNGVTSSAITVGAGTPTYRRDGATWTPANRDAVYDDLATGDSQILTIESVSLVNATWDDLLILGYSSPGFFFPGNFFGGLILDRAFTTEERTNTETYLAAKSGVTI